MSKKQVLIDFDEYEKEKVMEFFKGRTDCFKDVEKFLKENEMRLVDGMSRPSDFIQELREFLFQD